MNQEEKVSLDADHAAEEEMVEATAELVLDEDANSMNATPERKRPAYVSLPPHLLGGLSPPRHHLNSFHSSMQSLYTTATATTGGASRRTTLPNPDMLTFKHQVDEFTPPSLILSSRHVQTLQPEEPQRRGSGTLPECDRSAFSQHRFTEPAADNRSMETELILRGDGFPDGLARNLVREVTSLYPLRFWCIDNSASMFKDDCRRFVNDETRLGNNSHEPTVKCTRWMELQETAKYHARLAGLLGATTIFRLLNHYSNEPQEYVVSRESDTAAAIAMLEGIQPDGVSLLTQHVSSIHERIQSMEHDLRQQGQKVVVVLATDGLPSNRFGESTPEMQQDFINSLKQLQLLPVWIVVRLCTTDRDVLNFYRRLDMELERPVDVIGSFLIEAKEVARLNKWLNYALPLHRAREMGLSSRLPDLLDERQLTKDEFLEMTELLFDKDALEAAPNVHSDWYEFVNYLKEHVLPRTGQQWNPATKRVECWIDCGKLKTAYGAGLWHKKDKLVLGMQRTFSKDVI